MIDFTQMTHAAAAVLVSAVAGVDLVDDFDFAFLTHIIFSMVSQLLRYLLELLKKFRQVLQNDFRYQT